MDERSADATLSAAKAGSGTTNTTDESDRARLARLRHEFPIVESRTYLFSGGLAPAPRRATAAVAQWLELWSVDPNTAWERRFASAALAREHLAHLLGAESRTIAITDNTSRACNLAVALLDPSAGANVVVDATTYPSCLYPWLPPLRAGIEVRRAPSGRAGLAASLTDLTPLVDDRTVAISVTHVDPNTGVRHELQPLADLAHVHGAVLIADIAQSAGVIPIDVRVEGIDLAMGTAMKWLLGPPGIGYLYVSSELLARTGAPQAGYVGSELDPADEQRVRIHPDARRHELGLPNMLGLPGFVAGLELVEEAEVTAIAAHVELLVDRCLTGLAALGLPSTTPTSPALRAGLVVVPADDPMHLHTFLRDRKIDVWGSERRRIIRIDPYFFNDAHDIDRCLNALEDYMTTYGTDSIQPV